MSDSASSIARIRRTAVLVVALVLLLPTWDTEAHEIPADVTVQAYIRAEGNVLRAIVRVPLVSMRDFNWRIRDPGYLDIPSASAMGRDAAVLWIGNFVTMYEGGESLGYPEVAASRISIPGDNAFRSYETALEGVLSPPLPEDIDLPLQQAMFDVLLEWPITSPTSDFSIDAGWGQLGIRTVTVLRFITPGGAERDFQYTGVPGLVRLDPRWHQAALRFVVLGFQHILDGIDHLLFLFCLIIPFRRFWTLVPIITSFTIAHSITLIASALGLAPNSLWFPPLIETLIAASIVFMAFENIVGAKLERRWMVSFGFGLVHGFGFSFALSESLQFAGSHLLMSLVSFNVGVELGQLLVLAITVPLLSLLFKRWLPELMGTIALSAFLAHTGWHWMVERGAALLQYQFTPPAFTLMFLATLMRWLMLALIIAGTAWVLKGAFAALGRRHPGGGPRPPEPDASTSSAADAATPVAAEG
jgi:hypothetical protein